MKEIETRKSANSSTNVLMNASKNDENRQTNQSPSESELSLRYNMIVSFTQLNEWLPEKSDFKAVLVSYHNPTYHNFEQGFWYVLSSQTCYVFGDHRNNVLELII